MKNFVATVMRLRKVRCLFTLVIVNVTLFLVFINIQTENMTVLRDFADNLPVEDVHQDEKKGKELGDDHQMKRRDRKIEIPPTSQISGFKMTTTKTTPIHVANLVCPLLKRPGHSVPNLQQWLPLVFGSKDMYGFSAYLDNVSRPGLVRIIGLFNRSISTALFCQLWYSGNTLLVSPGRLKPIPEDHGRRYRAVYLLCPLPTDDIPFAVSVVTEKCQKTSIIFPVQMLVNTRFEFTMCVTPFNYQYGRAYELVEMIEANRLMGANYFVFYNYSTNKNVDQVLKQYSEEGLVEVIQWHLPMTVDTYPKQGQPEVHYFAQMAALNDCVHRNLYRSKYLVFTDMDELIVPHVHDTWTGMIDSFQPASAFIFQCVFFRKEWPDVESDFPEKQLAQKYKVQSILKQKREEHIFRHFHRSKYIIKPDQIETVGIHNIWSFREHPSELKVPSHIALLHHYRNWEDYTNKQGRVSDTRMAHFQKELISKIDQRWQKLVDVPLDMLRDFEKSNHSVTRRFDNGNFRTNVSTQSL